jgi:phosphate transport system substrate-binding protein
VPKDLKTIEVGRDEAGPFVLPSIATVNDNSYPIARDLYMYTAGQPTGAVKDYLDWIITSTEAQQIVAQLGFVPIKIK